MLVSGKKVKILALLMVSLLTVFIFAGCAGKSGQKGDSQNDAITLNASGSSFIYPLFSKMFDVYNKENKGVTVNYQSTGSGTGIKQLIEGTTNFGATDAPMNDEEIAQAGGNVLHVPITLGAVAVAFNLEGVENGKLNLTNELLADIFLGKITKWNDPKITAVNSGVTLPNKEIVVMYRTDGSGTTYTFTEYLTAVNETWKSALGTGKSVEWPVGIGGKGNEGVAGQLMNTPGAIAYVGLEYAAANNIPVASIKNKEGEFIAPSLESVSAAAANAVEIVSEDLRFSMANMPGKGSYPITAVTWAIVRAEQKEMNVAKALVNVLNWANTEGQKYAPDLNYAPIPKELQELNQKQLEKITVGGKKVLE